jgi:hypothetical protein
MSIYTDTAQVRFRNHIKATRNGQLCIVDLEIPVYCQDGSETPTCVYRRISRVKKLVEYYDMVQYTRRTGRSRDEELGVHALVGEVFRALSATLNYRWNTPHLLWDHLAAVLREEEDGYRRAQLELLPVSMRKSYQQGYEEHQLSLFPS